MGVWPLSVSAWVFSDLAGVGVEAADELAKATGVCARVLRPVGECEQSTDRPLRGLHGRTDTMALCEERGKAAGAGWTDDDDNNFTPADCLFLRATADMVTRGSSHNILLGCVSLSLDKCTSCEHLDMRINNRIVLIVCKI